MRAPPPKSRILREIVGLLEGQDERTQAPAAELVQTVVRRR